MNPLSAIGHSYLRWRHSRGFGVHSPFAYNLVKMAVRPGRRYGYYGYYDIDRALLAEGAGEYPRLRRDAMLLLRLLASLRSRRLLCPEGSPATFKAVAEAVGIPCVTFSRLHGNNVGYGDFIVCPNDCLVPDIIRQCLISGAAVMAISPTPEIRNAIEAFRDNGTRFDGKRIVIAIPNPDMAFVDYEMKL
ncbi:MAG: hypothetical protein K2M27_00080 [Muribaculaceae bacterium]|nr:hypothetical protein [Muribaculaceae bacterium]MDE6531915.1 hypothetical protein [Muribaculaceae bacterium]